LVETNFQLIIKSVGKLRLIYEYVVSSGVVRGDLRSPRPSTIFYRLFLNLASLRRY
jgi:hypothetical protein